jgi:hypothetical protein
MGKGVTLSKEELIALRESLNSMDWVSLRLTLDY